MLETSFDDRLDAEIKEIIVSHICVICNQGQEMTVSDALGTYTGNQCINYTVNQFWLNDII